MNGKRRWVSRITSKRYNWHRLNYEDFEAQDDDEDLKVNKKIKSSKANNKDEETEKKRKEATKMMNLMFHLQKWKRKLNQR